MNAAIIGLAREPVDGDDVELETETNHDDRGITVDGHRYLDDAVIYSGTAAGYAEVTDTEVHVYDNIIETEQVEGREHVAADYYADFDADPAWVGISTSKAEFVWDRLGALAGTEIERATVDLDAFAREYESREDARVWQVSRERDTEDSDEEGVSISYHDDAHVQDATRGGLSQLGFSYRWQGKSYVRGTIAASGYVAVYSNMTVESFGRWLRDELLPFASLPEGGQSILKKAAEDAEPDECEECGREPERDLHEAPDGREVCVTCLDKLEDEVESRATRKLDDLDTVTVTDGGNGDA